MDQLVNPELRVAAKKSRRVPPRALIVLAAALLIGTAGVIWLNAAPSRVSTDNAYLKADSTYVAPKIHGLVAEILVKDNQPVHAGDPLVKLDDDEYAARVAMARADVGKSEAAVAAAKASLARLDGEASLASANVRAAETAIRASRAESNRALRDKRRYTELAERGFAPGQQVDAASTTAIAADADADKALAALDVAKSSSDVVGLRRAELQAALDSAAAQLLGAKAALDLALQDEGHAVIVAPVDGVVGNRQVERGEYVQPGSRLMAIVPMQALYVIANFKETQTGAMHPGQPATIEVDALGRSFTGKVESLAPGSGSEFALLPFEPGTGNFTKIVQRVPVRIALDPGQGAETALRPGLSVEATVDLSER